MIDTAYIIKLGNEVAMYTQFRQAHLIAKPEVSELDELVQPHHQVLDDAAMLQFLAGQQNCRAIPAAISEEGV